MSQGNHAYIDHVRRLEQRLGSGNEALRLAVGGESEAVGKLEYYLLRSLGLTTGPLVVDIGCGSGRLAQQLAPDKGIRYIGTDVVPRLIESAQALTMRDDWKFSVVDDVQIPCTDNVADFVTFFSVLTHTTHEESCKYLQEASRCLKVGGHVVISFLEFRIPCHWETLIASVKAKAGGPLIQFLDRDAIAAWQVIAAPPSTPLSTATKVISRFPKRFGGKMGPPWNPWVILVSPSRCCEKSRRHGRSSNSMEQRIIERIGREFQGPDQNRVLELLVSYSGPESDRVRWDILELSRGKLEKIGEYLKAAQTDYRDILYWAEYYQNDPMLRGRDPKQMVDEIIAKWRRKSE